MAASLVTLNIHPTAYTLTTYKGIRCLCINSRPEPNKRLLVYVDLNLANLHKFKSDYTLPDTYIIATLLSLFEHIPYTPLTLQGIMSMEITPKTISYFMRQIDEWYNEDAKNINTKIRTLFFDIEVDGTAPMFPIPDRNNVTCISMHLENEPTVVLTTFPVDQLRSQQEYKEYIQYDNEYTMITFFLEQCIKVDRIVQYNGNSFDWPFLLARLNTYTMGTRFWLDLTKQEGFEIKLDTAFYPTPFGMKERLILSIPTLEHIDLLYVCKRLFPFWPNTKLDTAGRELTNAGKFGFEMKEYFQLIEAIAGAKAMKEPLTPKSLRLLEQALIYSKVDCDVLVAIYEKLATYRNLAHEFCYLCAQDWSESSEAIGLLSQLNPFIVQVVFTKPTLKLTIGLYKEVNVFIVRKFILQACKNQQLKEKLLTAVSSHNVKLIDFFQLLAQLYDYPDYIDQGSYTRAMSEYFSGADTTYIGSLGAYVYGRVSGIEPLYTHENLIVPTTASWLSVTTEENKISIDSKGKAKICQPMPEAIETILKQELAAIVKGISENRLTKYVKDTKKLTERLFLPEITPILEDYMEKTSITLANYTTYESLLSEEEKKYLSGGGEFVTIETVETESGIARVYPPYKQNLKLNIKYYVNMLAGHLTTLNKILTTKVKT